VKEIFESTPNSDRGLRDIVIRIVAIHADILTQNAEFRRLIEDVGDLGLSVMCQLLITHSEEKSALESRIKELETDNAVLKRQLKEYERGLNRKSEKIDSTISKINSLVECRYCKKGFNIDMESYFLGAIRYKGCRTMHYT